MNEIERYIQLRNQANTRVVVSLGGQSSVGGFSYLRFTTSTGQQLPTAVYEDLADKLNVFTANYEFDGREELRKAAKDAVALAQEIQQVAEERG